MRKAYPSWDVGRRQPGLRDLIQRLAHAALQWTEDAGHQKRVEGRLRWDASNAGTRRESVTTGATSAPPLWCPQRELNTNETPVVRCTSGLLHPSSTPVP